MFQKTFKHKKNHSVSNRFYKHPTPTHPHPHTLRVGLQEHEPPQSQCKMAAFSSIFIRGWFFIIAPWRFCHFATHPPVFVEEPPSLLTSLANRKSQTNSNGYIGTCDISTKRQGTSVT